MRLLDKLELPRVLVADCPWQFSDKLPGGRRGAEKNYKSTGGNVLSLDDLKRIELPEMDTHCHLFFWRVSAMVEEAYAVVRAWGFKPKSELVWRKLTVGGKRWFGMGRHVRAEHETCIIAVRGAPKVLEHATRSVFDAEEPGEGSVLEAPCLGHSAKPDEFYALVERLCPGPRVELFARKERPGWDCYGNQVANNPRTIRVRPA